MMFGREVASSPLKLSNEIWVKAGITSGHQNKLSICSRLRDTEDQRRANTRKNS